MRENYCTGKRRVFHFFLGLQSNFMVMGGIIMKRHIITSLQLSAFSKQLRIEDRCASTIEKYIRDISRFTAWQGEREVTKECTSAWRDELLDQGYSPVTINAMIAALNKFVSFVGWEECRVKPLRLQKRFFRDGNRELTREEYVRLVQTARSTGRERLALLLEAVCATEIRVSEVKYLTVQAAKTGRVEIFLKGKVRVILIPKVLCRKLLTYARAQKNASGEIFLTRSGRGLSRKQIWAEMKSLCGQAGGAPEKVFPHNLRHLFARTFFHVCHDVVKLADILGHSSIETTRVYLVSTGAEHARTMEQMHLLL